ncbi:MAG: hypothetical protein K8R49_02000, partial [Candidatus Cloacimonetes bacterium]|nr:hypothetical protein [Candidatus Cloacimonadota bacterium]
MKKIIILAAIIGSVGFLSAQGFELSFWNNIRNSSYTIEGDLHIRCETLELPDLQTDIFYTTQAGWESEEMQQVAGFTFGAIIPALQNETQYCRFKTETDTLVGMMPAFIPDDNFPPAVEELSYIASDPAGDVLDPECPNLDITGSYFGYSDGRFYGALTSDSGDFPLDCGGMFPVSFYFYVTCIVNPENVLVDSVVYAMIYADVPVLLSPGLYKITGTEFSLETFELIGSIEAQVIDTTLVMACDIETLVNDELFGDWPNVTNSLGVGMITAKYTLPTEFLLMDSSKASLQNIDQYAIEPFTNVLPEISNTGCSVGAGFTAFNCTYYDQNGHFPIIAEIEIESTIYPILPTSFDYSEPVEFFTEIPETNWEFATFRFSDNGYELVEETIENNTGMNDLQCSKFDLQLSNYPNPFNPSTTISFNLTAEHAEDA